ncbi:MAG: DUF5615 family PIN-like protein [Peptococcaceae bacterium]|jgi:predicted nuclease of predicted toxin-antitoxin system|nr:DUF5615 family PIN-like protein [Peptococcaceae bacterium]
MRVVLDENIAKSVVERLRLDGHTVFHVKEISPGISDQQVIDVAMRESAVIVTEDKDFGDLVFRQNKPVSGVILVRLPGMPSFYKAEMIATVISRYSTKLVDRFSVISRDGLRIRKLSRST